MNSNHTKNNQVTFLGIQFHIIPRCIVIVLYCMFISPDMDSECTIIIIEMCIYTLSSPVGSTCNRRLYNCDTK